MDRRNREVRLKMAIIPETEFPGKIIPGNASYPYGQARDITTPSDGTGTPLRASLVNDIFGFLQATLIKGGVTPSGAPDTAVASQYLQALIALVDGRAFGRGQTYQTPTRAMNTTYTNNTPRPIELIIFMNWTGGSDQVTLAVGGFDVYLNVDLGVIGDVSPLIATVNPGETYMLSSATSTTVNRWVEKR